VDPDIIAARQLIAEEASTSDGLVNLAAYESDENDTDETQREPGLIAEAAGLISDDEVEITASEHDPHIMRMKTFTSAQVHVNLLDLKT